MDSMLTRNVPIKMGKQCKDTMRYARLDTLVPTKHKVLPMPTLPWKLQTTQVGLHWPPLLFGAADRLACRLPISFTAMQLACGLDLSRSLCEGGLETRPSQLNWGLTWKLVLLLHLSDAGGEIVSLASSDAVMRREAGGSPESESQRLMQAYLGRLVLPLAQRTDPK